MTFGFSRDDAGKFLGAYYDKKIYESDPFARLDQVGVGKLVDMAAKARPRHPSRAAPRHLRRARRRPQLRRVLPQGRPGLRVLQPLPRSHRPVSPPLRPRSRAAGEKPPETRNPTRRRPAPPGTAKEGQPKKAGKRKLQGSLSSAPLASAALTQSPPLRPQSPTPAAVRRNSVGALRAKRRETFLTSCKWCIIRRSLYSERRKQYLFPPLSRQRRTGGSRRRWRSL